MYIREQPYHGLGESVGPFEGTFTGTIRGDKDSAAPLNIILTDRDNKVTGQITLGKGLKLALGGFCLMEDVHLSSINISGRTSSDNPRYFQTSVKVTESPVNTPAVKSVDINVTIKANLSNDGNTIAAQVTFDPLEGVISIFGIESKADLKKKGCMAKTLPVTLNKQTPTGSLKGYIYDRPLTALHFLRNEQPVILRPSQHYYYSNGRGLGADYSALHSSKEGKCPDEASLISPAAWSAEVVRLTDEIVRHAGENKWASVDKAYKCLESKGEELFDLIPKALANVTDIHQLGAQASNILGETLFYQTRLLREKRRQWALKMLLEGGQINDSKIKEIIDSLAKVDKLLQEIEMIYGAVTIRPLSKSPSKKQRVQLELTPVVWPFASDQRRSIEAASKAIKETGVFTGLLPKGGYTLGDQSFTVDVGTQLTGKKPKDVRWGK